MSNLYTYNSNTLRLFFDNKLSTFCTDPKILGNNGKLFFDQTSIGILNSLNSIKGQQALAAFIQTGDIRSYLFSRGGNIAFIILTLILLITIIAGLLAIFLCFPNRLKKSEFYRTARYSVNSYMNRTKKTILFISGVLLCFLLLGLCITTIVYFSTLSVAVKTFTCDVWISLKGHYFGAKDLTASESVPVEWQGTDNQIVKMTSLRNNVNPSAVSTLVISQADFSNSQKNICPLCQTVEDRFSGSTGLVNVLKNSTNAIIESFFRASLVTNALSRAVSRVSVPAELLNGENIRIRWDTPVKMRNSCIVERAMTRYAINLNETTQRGIQLFREGLRKQFFSNTSPLHSSFALATSTLSALIDVNSIIEFLTNDWMTISGIVTRGSKWLVAFGVILGIIGTGLVCGFGSITAVAIKRTQEKKSNTFLRPYTVTLLTLLIVFSAVTLFASSVLYFLAATGSDSCGFVETELFNKGDWASLPSRFWEAAKSKNTNIATVLNTCVKSNGNGDITSALSLRLLMKRLGAEMEKAKRLALSEVEQNLQFSVKERAAKQLGDTIGSAPDLLSAFVFESTLIIQEKEAHIKEYFFPDNTLNNNINFGAPFYVANGATFAFMDIAICKDTVNGLQLLDSCTPSVVISTIGANLQLKFLNELLVEVHSPITNFCPKYLETSIHCYKDSNTFIIDSYDKEYSKKSVFDNPRIYEFIKELHYKNSSDETLSGVIRSIAFLYYHDKLMRTPLQTVLDSLQLPEETPTHLQEVKKYYENNNASPSNKLNEKDLKIFFPNIGCNLTSCTLGDALNHWAATMRSTGDSVSSSFATTRDHILSFVKNDSTGVFERELREAEKSLADLNCQFIGASLAEGAKFDFCKILMPTVVTLATVFVALSGFSAFGSVLCWVLYFQHIEGDFVNVNTIESSLPPESVTKLDAETT